MSGYERSGRVGRAAWVAVVTAVVGISASMAGACNDTRRGGSGACAIGESRACACTDGAMGAQTCLADRTGFGACVCTATDMGTPPPPPPADMGTPPPPPPPEDMGTPLPRACVPGASAACACAGGLTGVQTCLPDGSGFGPCGSCSAMCTASTGTECRATSECCADPSGVPAQCVRLFGAGQLCTATCRADSDCRSNCCAALTDGSRACTVSAWCRSTAGCTVPVGGACSRDSDCCADPSGVNTICAGSPAVCSALCSADADCVSDCCAQRTSDGVRVCAPATVCRP